MDDPTLFARALSGEPTALDELLAVYIPRLRAFVRARITPELRVRESASDVVQSVCRELATELPRFQDRGEDGFRGWLFTTALNKVREKHRFHHRQQRDVGREGDPGSDYSGVYEELTPSEAAIRSEDVARIESALDRLDPDHREVISLARIARLPHAQVARQMGRSVGAVRQLLGRAVLRLAEEMGQRSSRRFLDSSVMSEHGVALSAATRNPKRGTEQ